MAARDYDEVAARLDQCAPGLGPESPPLEAYADEPRANGHTREPAPAIEVSAQESPANGHDRAESKADESLDYAARSVTFSVDQLQTEPPPRKFTLRPWFPQGCTTVIGGPGGSGKTSLLVEAAVHICRGEMF